MFVASFYGFLLIFILSMHSNTINLNSTFFSGTHAFFYSDGLYRMMLQLVWICKQHDVFQFEYWLYFNVFSRIKNTHSHSNTIVLCKIGNYRGINLYVTFITVSLTKKTYRSYVKNPNGFTKGPINKNRLHLRWISECISWDLLHNNWEYNCASIVLISEYHRGKIRTFFEFVHKKSNFSLHLIAIVKDARIDDFLLTARQMTTFNRPAWFENFSFWCEKKLQMLS